MKGTSFTYLSAMCAAVLALSCAKQPSEETWETPKRNFDDWIALHYSGKIADSTALGALILSDEPGDGAEITDSAYLFVDYRTKVMETGVFVDYTDEETERLMHPDYDTTSYFGPRVMRLIDGNVNVGMRNLIKGSPKTGAMKTGGVREGIIPFWLNTNNQTPSTKQGYLNAVPSGVNSVTRVKIAGQTKDITQWQQDRIREYADRQGWITDPHHRSTVPYVMDSCGRGGIWYCRTGIPSTEKKFPTDTTIYINYVGRLASGRVFDTNIEKVAKDWGLWKDGNMYSPVPVAFSTDSTALKMSGSGVIKGFSLGIWQMHPYESGVALFPSDYGYSSTGSGNRIPGYAPLVFEIDIVGKPR